MLCTCRLLTTDQKQCRYLWKKFIHKWIHTIQTCVVRGRLYFLLVSSLAALSSWLVLTCILYSLPFYPLFFLHSAVACALTQSSLFLLFQISVYRGVCIRRITVMKARAGRQGNVICVAQPLLHPLSVSRVLLPGASPSPTAISSPSL